MVYSSTARPEIKVNDYLLSAPSDKFGIWQSRLHIDDIFRELALPWNSEVNVVEIYYEIVNYCKTNHVMPLNIAWSVWDGILFADGKSIKRVGPKDYRPSYDDEANYWEGRCLSMSYPID